MRSAYGLQIPKEDPELTRVGLGTPCGELMRRYWQPACLSKDLTDLPKRVRVLGEDLVAFRDRHGRPGLLFFRCSHRGASLEYGRIEDQGIRCCYHGWLYDIEGNVLDMPLEPPGSPYKAHVKHPCYPVHEFGGVVFAYMGPLEKKPLFPHFDVLMREGGTLDATLGIRIGGSYSCNWLQAQENLMDVLHTQWLHTAHSEPQFPDPAFGIVPEVKYEETEMGMRAIMTRQLPDNREWEVIWEMVMPFTIYVLHTEAAATEKPRVVHFCLPEDDTHHLVASISWTAIGDECSAERGRKELGPAFRKDKSYEYTQRHPDDKEALEGQGPIAIHGLEHLATSDRGVIMFRKILRKQIAAMASGQDPKGIIRDSVKASYIPTTGGSVLREGVST